MNIQNLMREAQKMQADLDKKQKELESTKYEGSSSLVSVVMNGKKELISVKINSDSSIEKDELELLEDMLMVAVNDAGKKVEEDKAEKLSKYGKNISGLM
jgi:nucleoid-associated protein EbfC